VVDSAFVCVFGLRDVSGLFDLGSIPGEPLLAGSKRGELSFPVLFTGAVWGFAACDFRAEAGLVACVALVFTSLVRALGASRVPAHLLLLSGRLLQSVLGGSACVRRR